MNEQENSKVKKITLGIILGWVLGVLFAIAGISSLFSQPLAGIFMILLAIILLPPANKLIADKFKFSISGGVKFILVIILLGIIGAIMSTGGDKKTITENDQSQTETLNNQEQQEAVIKITASQLVAEYKANQVAADSKYKGKTVEIAGTISTIGKDILDTPYISLNGDGIISDVQCMFDKSDQGELTTLSKDTRITLRGEVGNYLMNVIVRDCSIVK